MRSILILLTMVVTVAAGAQCTSGLSGTYKIGPTGYFPSITRALDTLRARGVAAPVLLELQAGYQSSVETFPLRLTEYPCADSTRAVTLRPETGASNLEIVSNHDSVTFDINTGDYFIIDGRSGGTGTTKNLHISNTHLNGMAVRLINDASYNKLKYVHLKGVTRYAGRAVLTIADSDRPKGNDRNRIDTCAVSDGATTPSALVLFASNIIGNNNNLLNGCDLYNFHDADNSSYAISIQTGNDSTAIVGNSIYQTTPRSYLGPIGSHVYGIYVNGFIGAQLISDNYIGGTEPRAGGDKMTLTGFTTFRALAVSSRSGAAFRSILQNNTIRNLRLSSNGWAELVMLGNPNGSGANYFNGYFLNNTIGSNSIDSSITFRNTQTASNIFYTVNLNASNSDSVLFNNNRMGGIYIHEPANPLQQYVRLYMLWVQSGGGPFQWKVTVKGNEFGSAARPRSVWNRSSGEILGIIMSTLNCSCSPPITPNTIRIEDNLISNLAATAPPPPLGNGAASILAISISGQAGAYVSVSGNRISHLVLDNPSPFSPVAVAGIQCYFPGGASSTYDIKSNVIHSLYSLRGGDYPNRVAGIHLDGPANNLTVNISRNFIHSLKATSGWRENEMIGISNEPGHMGSIDNNMIRLGLDSLGQSITSHGLVLGILERNGGTAVLHNSVFIGGEGVVPIPNYEALSGSAAYYRPAMFEASATNTIRNNIFVNLRKNAAASPYHAALQLVGPMPAGLRFNNNLYQAGSGSSVAWYNAVPNTLAQWKSASGQDAQSVEGDPNFVNPNGAVAVVDLHIKGPSPADGAGTAAFTTAFDFDGDLRTNLSPVDIGADAGNYAFATGVGQLQAEGYEMKAYPNPAANDLYLQITAPATVKAEIRLFTVAGQTITTKKLSLARGRNTLHLPEMEGLVAGTYLVELRTAKGNWVAAVVKR